MQAQFRIPIILITHEPEDVRAFVQTLVVYAPGRVDRIMIREDFSGHPVFSAPYL
jgi:ABC-type thiamine transport system ATPase subunit